jgi:hypothetical protein
MRVKEAEGPILGFLPVSRFGESLGIIDYITKELEVG